MKRGLTNIIDVKRGSTQISKIMRGKTLIWEKAVYLANYDGSNYITRNDATKIEV